MASWIRFRSRFVAALLVFALTSITVMGCATNGSESSPSSPGTDAGYDSAAKAPEQSSNDVQQRTDLSNEHISSWNRYEVVSMGNPKCHGVRATVDEDSSAVLITLYEGTLPNAPTECAAIAVNASLLLTTRNPIGTRSVITG